MTSKEAAITVIIVAESRGWLTHNQAERLSVLIEEERPLPEDLRSKLKALARKVKPLLDGGEALLAAQRQAISDLTTAP